MSVVDTDKVWDVFIRFFHWALVAALIFCWWSARQDAWLEWHMVSGYIVLALVMLRVLWGLVGKGYARFGHFVRSPLHVWRYVIALIKGRPAYYLGHNPAGAWGVVALLVLCGVQAGTGLFANDDIFLEGPLAQYVSSATSGALTAFHKQWFNLLLAVAGLHVLAVLYHQVIGKEALLQSMLTGRKPTARAVDKIER